MSAMEVWLLKPFRAAKGTNQSFLNEGKVNFEKEGLKWKASKIGLKKWG